MMEIKTDFTGRRFGIEFEVIMKSGCHQDNVITDLRAINIDVTSTYYSHTTNGNNTSVWTIKPDASIQGNGFEIVSPVLSGLDGLESVKKVCSVLSRYCTANKSCGMHVHHEAINMSNKAFVNVYKLYSLAQNHIDLLLPKSRRHICKTFFLPERFSSGSWNRWNEDS